MTTTLATVLYEGTSVLRETLPGWAESCRASGCDEVVIVDNSLSDDPSAIVGSLDWGACRVHYLRDPANPGFAASANRAVAEATGDRVFLLNADVFLTPEALEEVVRLDRASPYVAVSLVTRGRRTSGISIDSLGYFSDRSAADRPCLGPSGGAAIVDRSSFLRLGGFDTDLFAWGEDAGFALRLWASGARTSELDLALLHVGGHTVASLDGLRRKARLLARNRLLILRRQYTRPLALTVGVLQVALILANGARKLRARTAVAHFAGVLEGLSMPAQRVEPALRFGLAAYREATRLTATA